MGTQIPLFLTHTQNLYNIPSLALEHRIDCGYVDTYNFSNKELAEYKRECDYNADQLFESYGEKKDFYMINDLYSNFTFYKEMGENEFFNQAMTFPSKELERFKLKAKNGNLYIDDDQIEQLKDYEFRVDLIEQKAEIVDGNLLSNNLIEEFAYNEQYKGLFDLYEDELPTFQVDQRINIGDDYNDISIDDDKDIQYLTVTQQIKGYGIEVIENENGKYRFNIFLDIEGPFNSRRKYFEDSVDKLFSNDNFERFFSKLEFNKNELNEITDIMQDVKNLKEGGRLFKSDRIKQPIDLLEEDGLNVDFLGNTLKETVVGTNYKITDRFYDIKKRYDSLSKEQQNKIDIEKVYTKDRFMACVSNNINWGQAAEGFDRIAGTTSIKGVEYNCGDNEDIEDLVILYKNILSLFSHYILTNKYDYETQWDEILNYNWIQELPLNSKARNLRERTRDVWSSEVISYIWNVRSFFKTRDIKIKNIINDNPEEVKFNNDNPYILYKTDENYNYKEKAYINPQILLYSYNLATMGYEIENQEIDNKSEEQESPEEEPDIALEELKDWFGYFDYKKDNTRYFQEFKNSFYQYWDDKNIKEQISNPTNNNLLYKRQNNYNGKIENENENIEYLLENYKDLYDLKVINNKGEISDNFDGNKELSVDDYMAMFYGYYYGYSSDKSAQIVYEDFYKNSNITSIVGQKLNNVYNYKIKDYGILNPKKIFDDLACVNKEDVKVYSEKESLYLGYVNNHLSHQGERGLDIKIGGGDIFPSIGTRNVGQFTNELLLPWYIKNFVQEQEGVSVQDEDSLEKFKENIANTLQNVNFFYYNLFILRNIAKDNGDFILDDVMLLETYNRLVPESERIEFDNRCDYLNDNAKLSPNDKGVIKKRIKEQTIDNLNHYNNDSKLNEVLEEYRGFKKNPTRWFNQIGELNSYFALEQDLGIFLSLLEPLVNSTNVMSKDEFIEIVNNLNYQVGQLQIQNDFKKLSDPKTMFQRSPLEYTLYYKKDKTFNLKDFFSKIIQEYGRQGTQDIISTYYSPDWRFKHIILEIKDQMEDEVENNGYSMFGENNMCNYIKDSPEFENEKECENFLKDLERTLERDEITSYFSFYKKWLFPIEVEYKKEDFYNAYTKQFNRKLFGECTSYVHLSYPTFENLTRSAYLYCNDAQNDGFENEQIKPNPNHLVAGDVFVWGNASQGGVGEYGHTGIVSNFVCMNGENTQTASECNEVKGVIVDHANRKTQHNIRMNDFYPWSFFSRVFSCGIDPGAPRNLIYDPINWLDNNSPYRHKVYESGEYIKTIGR